MGLTDTPVPLPSGATATTAASGGNREAASKDASGSEADAGSRNPGSVTRR